MAGPALSSLLPAIQARRSRRSPRSAACRLRANAAHRPSACGPFARMSWPGPSSSGRSTVLRAPHGRRQGCVLPPLPNDAPRVPHIRRCDRCESVQSPGRPPHAARVVETELGCIRDFLQERVTEPIGRLVKTSSACSNSACQRRFRPACSTSGSSATTFCKIARSNSFPMTSRLEVRTFRAAPGRRYAHR